MNEVNKSKIQNFWKKRARKYGLSSETSWGDMLMKKEVDILEKYLHVNDKVLDVGCANGYSSIQLAIKQRIILTGIDYVPKMIQNANLLKKGLVKAIQRRIFFKVGNALSLNFSDNSFDKVIFTRSLCNLTGWEDQLEAIKEAIRVVKPNGSIIISEPTIQGLTKLNAVGKFFALKQLTMPWHNLYLDEERLIKEVPQDYKVEIKYFSSTYYLFSRIFYRWLMRDNPKKLERTSIFNKIGVILPSFGNWGVQRLYIIRKIIHYKQKLT